MMEDDITCAKKLGANTLFKAHKYYNLPLNLYLGFQHALLHQISALESDCNRSRSMFLHTRNN